MSALDPADVADWQGAVGRQQIEDQTLDGQYLRRYALAVGLSDDGTHPPLAHWAFFLPAPSDEGIGPDGHPRRGDFLPDVSLPRRMFASATMAFLEPLLIGMEAQLTSTVTDITHKSGSSGDLIFAKVERVLSQAGLDRVREEQTYVYRADGEPVPMPILARPAPPGEQWEPDEVNLFRFSAATFNGHRIHYDLPYARGVEGYPSLVIHGPFTAAKLALLASTDGDLARFSFRAQAPLFLGQPVFLQRGESTGEYRAVRADGVIAMTAQVRFR